MKKIFGSKGKKDDDIIPAKLKGKGKRGGDKTPKKDPKKPKDPVKPIKPVKPKEPVKPTLVKPKLVPTPKPSNKGKTAPPRLVRKSPTGSNASEFSHITMVFDQQMVLLTTVEETDRKIKEIEEKGLFTIEPKVEGELRWEDPKMLKFRPKEGYKNDVQYKVKIKKELASVDGVQMSGDVNFQFKTKPIQLYYVYPDKYIKVKAGETILACKFNCNFGNAEKVVPHLVFERDEDKKKLEIELVSREEAEKMIQTDVYKKQYEGNMYYLKRWITTTEYSKGEVLFFKFKSDVGYDKKINITFYKQKKYIFSLGPMKLREMNPRENQYTTKDTFSFYFYFTNPIDKEKVKYSVKPDLPVKTYPSTEYDNKLRKSVPVNKSYKKMEIHGSQITIRGEIPRGNMKYTFEFKNVFDVFDQEVEGKSVKKELQIKPLAWQMRSGYRDLNIIDTSLDEDQGLSLTCLNIKTIHVKVIQVEPKDYTKFSSSSEPKFGKVIKDEKIETKAKLDEFEVFTYRFKWEYLQDKKNHIGALIVCVNPVEKMSEKDSYYGRNGYRHWFTFTKHSIDTFSFPGGNTYCYVNRLKDGAPVTKNVKFYSKGMKELKATKENSLFKVEGPEYEKNSSSYFTLITKIGKDMPFLQDVYCNKGKFSERYNFFVFDERKMYQAGDTVHIKGYIRKLVHKDITYDVIFPEVDDVFYELKDARYTSVLKGKEKSKPNGTFNFVIKLDKDLKNMGNYNLQLKYKNKSFNHSFKVEEFKTPSFLVNAQVLNVGSIHNKDKIKVKLKANYLDNTAVKNAKVEWKATKNTHSFTPKSGYNFTEQDNYSRHHGRGYSPFFGGDLHNYSTFKGKTDKNGVHTTSFGADHLSGSYRDGQATQITIIGQVTDVDQQTISSRTSCIVYPSKKYVGIKFGNNYSFKIGERLNFSFIVVDEKGFVLKGVKFQVKIMRENGEEKYKKEVVSKEKEISLFELEKDLKLEDKGRYQVEATITEKGNKHKARSWFSIVTGADDGVEKVVCENVTLSPNKSEYKVKDVANVLVTSPFDANSYCSGILFGMIEGLAFNKTFEIKKKDKNMTVVSFPIKENYLPNLRIHCRLYGSKFNQKMKKVVTSHGKGEIDLNVSIESLDLDVAITPQSNVFKPGGKAKLTIVLNKTKVKNIKATECEIALVVVDKGILSLSGFELDNPLKLFYPRHSPYIRSKHMRDLILMKLLEKENSPAPPCKCASRKKCAEECCCEMAGGMGGPGGGGRKAVVFRKDFNPVAYYNANLKVSKDLKTVIEFKLPDSITTYQCWALVTKGSTHFGLGKNTFQTDKDFQIEPKFPRHVNYIDKIDLCVLLYNKTGKKQKVIVETKILDDKIVVLGKTKSEVVVNHAEKTKFLIPVEVKKSGQCTVQVIGTIKGTDNTDAVQEVISVHRPSTTEDFAEYGELFKDKEDLTRKLGIPIKEVFDDYGGVKLDFSSTAVSNLTDAFIHLYGYQYNCVEQISSKIMACIAIHPILESFNAPGIPNKNTVIDLYKTGLCKFRNSVHNDGSYGFWPSSSSRYPYVSMFVALVLCRMKKDKIAVDDALFNKSKSYCLNFCDKCKDVCNEWYSLGSKYSLKSFSVYVLTHMYLLGLLNDNEKTKIVTNSEKIFKDSDNEGDDKDRISLDGLAWLLFSIATCAKEKMEHPIAKKILETLNNNVNETPQTANFITNYSAADSSVMLCSSRRTDGICLEVLCHLQPENMKNLMPKLVKGLLNSKVKGRAWRNTQENIFILLGLRKYFEVYEKNVPDFTVEFKYDKDIVGKTVFKGREKDVKSFNLPMKTIVKKGKSECVVSKKGKGTLYWRMGVSYSPKNIMVTEKERGFKVSQVYQSAGDKKGEVVKNKDGSWTFKLGALVRVAITMETETRRYHVAMVSNVPSCGEPLNPNLKTTGVIPQENYLTGYHRGWGVHKNYKLNKVEVFASRMSEGKFYFSYVFRVMNSGTKFIVPPVKCEEMYSPEIWGRGKTHVIKVVK